MRLTATLMLATSLLSSPLMAQTMGPSGTPTLEFQEGYQFSITQVCIDKGHLRPFQPIREVCGQVDEMGERLPLNLCPNFAVETLLLKRPVMEISRYDLGEGRQMTRVDRLRTQDITLWNPSNTMRPPARTYNVPSCPNSMIQQLPELILDKVPNKQELAVYTALFQRGITLIRQESLQFAAPIASDVSTIRADQFEMSFQAPQCQDGEIEFSEEFATYLKHPSAIDFLFRRIGGEGSGSGRIHPTLNLRLIGGEGSGSGRIVWGGEGSGSGRALEGRRIDHTTPSSGELVVNVNLDWWSFEQNEGELQHLIEELERGEPIPEDTIEVECR